MDMCLYISERFRDEELIYKVLYKFSCLLTYLLCFAVFSIKMHGFVCWCTL